MVGEQSLSHHSLWLGADCRQLMQVKVVALTPCAECLASEQGRENSLATPAVLLICPISFPASLPHVFLHA